MSVRIAIPEPTSADTEYNQRSLPPYLAALQSAGATPIVIPLHERQDRVARLLAGVQGILLPGSRYDVDPQRFGEDRIPACGPADPARTAVDELLIQDAFSLYKPILGICHGAQTLNVWCNGSLYQDLPTQLGKTVDHTPGRLVAEAHPVHIAPATHLAALLPQEEDPEPQVNSSHHQAIREVGAPLRVAAVSPADGVVEAVELDSVDHFVVAVQWHPERTYTTSAFSRALFAAFVHAAEAWSPRCIEESVAQPAAQPISRP
jgi:putative glutamine amidotransferase